MSRSLLLSSVIALYCAAGHVLAHSRGKTERMAPRTVVQNFIHALNRHDLMGMLSYLSDDFVFTDAASTFRVTKPALLPVLQWDIAVNSHVAARFLSADSDNATFLLIERNDSYQLLGLHQQSYRVRFSAREGIIREEIIQEIIKSGPGYSEALAPAIDWAALQRPNTLAKIYRNNKPILNGETAGTWIALLREWRKIGKVRNNS